MSDTDMAGRLDPEFVEPLEAAADLTGGSLDLNGIPGTRITLDAMFAALAAEVPPVEEVACEVIAVADAGNEPDVSVCGYRSEETAGMLPCLFWIHGGECVLGIAEQDGMMAKRFAVTVGCVVVSVGYRLAPKHPIPAPLEDCYAVLKRTAAACVELGIDPSRVAIGGVSAGGGLAAGLALSGCDRGEIEVVLLLLISPIIDDRNAAPASDVADDTLVWNRENSRLGWTAYLGPLNVGEDMSPYAAPFQAQDMTGRRTGSVRGGEHRGRARSHRDRYPHRATRLRRQLLRRRQYRTRCGCHEAVRERPRRCVGTGFRVRT